MKNQLEVITTSDVLGKTVNVYGTAEDPLFLAKDVAEWIDYAKTSRGAYNVSVMLQGVDDDEKVTLTIFLSGQNRKVSFLTENGLYEVLMQSRKPIAKQFKRKVKYILSNIRRNRCYDVFKVIEDMFNDKEASKQLSIYTYLLTDKSGLVKIGRTANIHNRMKQYSTHNPTYKLLGYFDGDIELFLHNQYNDNNVINEWFDLSENQINNIINSFSFNTNLTTEIKQ